MKVTANTQSKTTITIELDNKELDAIKDMTCWNVSIPNIVDKRYRKVVKDFLDTIGDELDS